MNNIVFYKKIHLTGVGGISMSAIASYLLQKGYTVSGSDIKENSYTRALKIKGLKFYSGHFPDNVKGVDLVVYNSAISKDNPELSAAKSYGIKTVSRMDFLSEISKNFNVSVGIAGCHGKTTCTGMIASVLIFENKKVFSHVGGEVIPFGNCYYSGDDIFLTEVCEYMHNVDRFTADISCVTNVDFDHPDCYKNKEEIAKAYLSYLSRAKKAVINADDEYLSLIEGRVGSISYGILRGKIQAKDVVEDKYGIRFKLCDGKNVSVQLSVNGIHNVYNALCSYCVLRDLGINKDRIISGLEQFKGVKRRFEKWDSFQEIPVIFDYAHHPSEIVNVIKTVKKLYGNNISVIFQPHTYSRTKYLLNEFFYAFKGIKKPCFYKTFAARENYDEEGSAKKIAEKLNLCVYAETEEQLKKYLRRNIKEKSVILVLGAGDIYDIVKKILSEFS